MLHSIRNLPNSRLPLYIYNIIKHVIRSFYTKHKVLPKPFNPNIATRNTHRTFSSTQKPYIHQNIVQRKSKATRKVPHALPPHTQTSLFHIPLSLPYPLPHHLPFDAPSMLTLSAADAPLAPLRKPV